MKNKRIDLLFKGDKREAIREDKNMINSISYILNHIILMIQSNDQRIILLWSLLNCWLIFAASYKDGETKTL